MKPTEITINPNATINWRPVGLFGDPIKHKTSEWMATDGAGVCPCGTHWDETTKSCKCITGHVDE